MPSMIILTYEVYFSVYFQGQLLKCMFFHLKTKVLMRSPTRMTRGDEADRRPFAVLFQR